MSRESRRSYRSPVRDEQARRTRAAIVESAHRLFVANGYAATSIREIAAAAGVSESAAYKAFGDKASILWAVVEAVVGAAAPDDGLFEVLEAENDPMAALRTVAHWSTTTYELGIADLERVIEEAAPLHPAIRQLAERAAQQRYQVTRALAEVIARKLPPIDPTELTRIAQFIWATDSSPVWRMLVEQQHWTSAEYEQWIYRLYCSLLPDQTNLPPTPTHNSDKRK